MTAFLALVKKDLYLFFHNPRAMIMSFAAPIILGGFFGYVFGGVSGDREPGQTQVVVVDQDQTAISQKIVASLRGEASLKVDEAAIDAAREQVRKGSVPVGVVFPAGFSAAAAASMFRPGTKPKLHLLIDPSHQIEAQMIEGMLMGKVMQEVSKEAFGGATGRSAAADGLKALEASGMPQGQRDALKELLTGASKFDGSVLGDMSVPFEVAKETLTARPGVEYSPYGHSFVGMTLQFTLFAGIDVGIGLLLLRQRGLWRRLRAAPVSKATVLGSRALSAAVTSLLIVCGVFLTAGIFFGVRIEGSIAGFLAVAGALGFMNATYGLLIASLGKTPEATRGLAILATIVMTMLSGAWVPSFLFPAWLQNASKVIPARWAVDGLDAMVWRGLDFTAAIEPTLVLLGFAAVFGLIALARFRWEEA